MAQFECVSTEADGVAVQDAGDDRRQLTPGNNHQDLITEPKACLSVSLTNQGAALFVSSKPHQVRVSEPFSDLCSFNRGCVAGFEILAAHLFEPHGDQ
jgi:hypothetical protein